MAPYPLTSAKLELGVALLMRGGYRFALNYLSAMKRGHLEREHEWTAALQLRLADCSRATRRGKGPDRQADVLPLDVLCRTPQSAVDAARSSSWPAAGLHAAIVAASWATREIESGVALLTSVSFSPAVKDEGPCGLAHWDLPASKADVEALGKTRTLPCSCPEADCPVRAMKCVVEASRDIMVKSSTSHSHWPLLVKVDGTPMAKGDMAVFKREFAGVAGLPHLWLPPHTARVTGAVRLALAGVSVWAIQVFCRWGSQTVLRYVKDAVLGHRADHLRRGGPAELGMTLRDLRKAMHSRTPHSRVCSHLIEQALETMGEDPSKNSPLTAAPKKDVVSELGMMVSTLHGELEDLRSRTLPVAAKCLRGKYHTVLTSKLAHCAWQWAKGDGVAVHEMDIPEVGSEVALADWCTKCLRRRALHLSKGEEIMVGN